MTDADDMRDDALQVEAGAEEETASRVADGDTAVVDTTAEEPPEGDPGEESPDEEAPARRRRGRESAPEMPKGYRASRRRAKAAKRARKAKRQHEVKEQVAKTTDSVARYSWLAGRMGLVGFAVAIGLVVALFGSAHLVNTVARWWAQREAERSAASGDVAQDPRENLLVIATEGETAHGFLALRVDIANEQVWGLAIPAAVFAEVPGSGFDRIGVSLEGGPEDSLVAVSNFLGVPFEQYVVVDRQTYQRAMEGQSVADLVDEASDTNLSAEAIRDLEPVMQKATESQIGLAPLPVKPISLGDEEYLEAETEKVADLLEEWWGVKGGVAADVVRVIVYNGAGSPGIAGTAAKMLVKSGFRVVGTGNADRFDYTETVIAVHSGDMGDGDAIRRALGVGKIVEQETGQQVADVIVIIGTDYAPSAQDG